MPREADQYPKRKVIETEDREVGIDPGNGHPVILRFDHLECGHEKHVINRTNSRITTFENLTRRCKKCWQEGKT